MRNHLTLLLAVVLSLMGCVPSLHPLYTDKDLVFEPALIGTWAENDDDKDTWVFVKSGDKQYKLTCTDEGKSGVFQAHLLKLGDTLYLDLYPDKSALDGLKQNDFYKGHLLGAHTFLKVRQIEPALRMSFLDMDWLKRHLEKHPKAIAHVTIEDDRLVLTATTGELQKFILEHSKQAFGDGEPSALKRVKPRP